MISTIELEVSNLEVLILSQTLANTNLKAENRVFDYPGSRQVSKENFKSGGMERNVAEALGTARKRVVE